MMLVDPPHGGKDYGTVKQGSADGYANFMSSTRGREIVAHAQESAARMAEKLSLQCGMPVRATVEVHHAHA